MLGGQEGMERPVDHDDDWSGGACTSTCARGGVPGAAASSGNFLAHNQSDAMGGLASFVFGACLQELLLPVVAVYAGSVLRPFRFGPLFGLAVC